MTDSKAMGEQIATAAKARGAGFSAYTERDDGPWYIIAGNRDDWHGLARVADTDTAKRDKARAFLLHMMGEPTPGYTFACEHSPKPRGALYWVFKGPGGARFTVWCDTACRVFPVWAACIGMTPRKVESAR